MKNYAIGLVVLLASGQFSTAQTTENTFFIGHSLVDQIPDMVKSLADDHPNVSFSWTLQSIPGSPLVWNFNNGTDYEPIDPYYYGYNHPTGGLPNGNFSQLVLTESVPRYASIIQDTYQYADSFYIFAMNQNPNIRVFVYEVWHCLLSGTPTGCDFDVDSNPWRQRLTDDLPMWEGVVNHLNNTHNPTTPVCLIPGGQGLARLYDAIQDGTVPGITSIDELFDDNIHLNDVGKYFIACIHFASIFNVSPVGLTNQTQVWWGGDFDAPTPAQAARFQQIAWETVQEYPNNCLNAVSIETEQLNVLQIYPNPAVEGQFYIQSSNQDKDFRFLNALGQELAVELIEVEDNLSLIRSDYRGAIFVIVDGKSFKVVL